MPLLNSEKRGDLLVKVIVKIPANLTQKQEELMKEAFVGGPAG
jgi:DnaJ-class molecular chaperone